MTNETATRLLLRHRRTLFAYLNAIVRDPGLAVLLLLGALRSQRRP